MSKEECSDAGPVTSCSSVRPTRALHRPFEDVDKSSQIQRSLVHHHQLPGFESLAGPRSVYMETHHHQLPGFESLAGPRSVCLETHHHPGGRLHDASSRQPAARVRRLTDDRPARSMDADDDDDDDDEMIDSASCTMTTSATHVNNGQHYSLHEYSCHSLLFLLVFARLSRLSHDIRQ